MIVSGSYDLMSNLNWRQSQTRRVQLDCDTSSGAVTILLPKIETLVGKNLQAVIVMINDFANNCASNNITINASSGDEIDNDGRSSIVLLENGAMVVLGIGSDLKWIALESNIGTAPASNSFGLYSQIADSTTIVNTTVESSLIGSGLGTLSVQPNQFKVGDYFTTRLGGKLSNLNNNRILFKIYSDGSVLLNSGFLQLKASTNKDWLLTVDFTVRAVGEAGVGVIHANAIFQHQQDGGQQFESFVFDTTNNTTFDTTELNTLTITAEWETADLGNSIFSNQFLLNKLF